MGIEPTSLAWKAKVLPLNYTRKNPLWWRGEDLNLRRLSRQIYSLIPLTTREPLPKIKPAIVLHTLMSVNINTAFNRDSSLLHLNGSRQHNYTSPLRLT